MPSEQIHDRTQDLVEAHAKYRKMPREELEYVTEMVAKRASEQILSRVQSWTPLMIAQSEVYREILLHA
ncbi:MAG: hypothetical protein ACJAWL_001614 [Motiliproteus sp.]|jgi:hypothetical protein